MIQRLALLLLVVLFAAPRRVVRAEILPFDLIVPATSASFRYTDGYIQAPGSIDLGELAFSTVPETYKDYNNDDDYNNRRRLLFFSPEEEKGAFAIDIAVFRLPDSCARTDNGCDWTTLGVGGKNDHGNVRFCCTQDAIEWGFCTQATANRLILQPGTWQGRHKIMEMPLDRDVDLHLEDGLFEFSKQDGSGQYAIVFANCNDMGRPVKITGEIVWKSVHGYLPGELDGILHFCVVTAFLYLIPLLFFSWRMVSYSDTRTVADKYILLAIFTGTAEMGCKVMDYLKWNTSGQRSMFWIYLDIIMRVLKPGITWCLLVILCHGWFVVRVPHRITFVILLVLGALYTIVLAVRDMMSFFVEDYTGITEEEQSTKMDVIWVLTILVAIVDMVFALWTLLALLFTLFYLKRTSQFPMMRRLLALGAVLFVNTVIHFTVLGFSYFKDRLVKVWFVDATMEVNYFVLLTSIAVLWRPRAAAQEYQLTAPGDKMNDLELTATPAEDEGDDHIMHLGEEYQVDKRFQID